MCLGLAVNPAPGWGVRALLAPAWPWLGDPLAPSCGAAALCMTRCWQTLALGSCSTGALPSKCPSTDPAPALPHPPALGTPLVRGWALAEPQLRGGHRDGHDALTTGLPWGLAVAGAAPRQPEAPALPRCHGKDFLCPTEATGGCGLSPVGGTLQALKLLSHGACSSPSSALPRGFSSPACDSAAEGPLLVFPSLEQGLSLHGLNFSFAAEFLSPNDLDGKQLPVLRGAAGDTEDSSAGLSAEGFGQ